MSEPLEYNDFAPHEGEHLEIRLDSGQTLPVQLIDVSPRGERASSQVDAGVRRQPFALLFRGPRKPCLPQKIYRVASKTLGEMDIFLVPLGPDGEGMRYEAIFT